jgi:hypothetical protein
VITEVWGRLSKVNEQNSSLILEDLISRSLMMWKLKDSIRLKSCIGLWLWKTRMKSDMNRV